jgi:hypothetical protein
MDDLRSAGCTIYEMIRFERPYTTLASYELKPITPIQYIFFLLEIFFIFYFLLECMVEDYKRRKSSEEILKELDVREFLK